MFTGIVEEMGEYVAARRGTRSEVLVIRAKKVLEGTVIGDSIAVNGVCLTVTGLSNNSFEADVMPETLRRSNLGGLSVGDHVNLERAMAADGRFGGHIVAGHVDGTGVIREITEEDNAVWYAIGTKPEILRYIVEKGSVAIDGISLTVAGVDDREGEFRVSIIPHTRAVTVLSDRRIGDVVNLENDIVGKYIERLMSADTNKKEKESRITMDFLGENGFL